MLRQHHPVARELPKGRIKSEKSEAEIEKTQKERTLKLIDTRKLSNAGNREIDAIM